MNTSPLLKEEWHVGNLALLPYSSDPFLLYWPSPVPAFAAHNHPMDTGQIDVAQIFQQRFYRQESNSSRSTFQRLNPWDAIFSILNAESPPDVHLTSGHRQIA